MKQSTLIAIVLGVVIVCAVALVALNFNSLTPSGKNTATAVPTTAKTASDVLEKFDALKAKVNASGMWFGGAAIQNAMGDESAMVYIYRPTGSSDISGLISGGFSALYTVFQTEDPLLVGLIDTTQKVSASQYKVDVYSMGRPMVEMYMEGNIAPSELVKKAIIITPQSQSVRGNNTTPSGKATVLPTPAKNFTPPADRQAYVVESLNRTSYKPISLQTGAMQDGGKAVSLAYSIPASLTDAQRYDAIETGLKLCAAAFGDYDRYYISLISEQGNEYYVVDAGSTAALDYDQGLISQDQLYRSINLTYYTK